MRVTSTYRYGNGYAVDVYRSKEGTNGVSDFICLVRGFGHWNNAPRKEYTITAQSNAQASRIVFQRYSGEFLNNK